MSRNYTTSIACNRMHRTTVVTNCTDLLLPSSLFTMRPRELLNCVGSVNVLQYVLYEPTLVVNVQFEKASILIFSNRTFWSHPVDMRYLSRSSLWKPVAWSDSNFARACLISERCTLAGCEIVSLSSESSVVSRESTVLFSSSSSSCTSVLLNTAGKFCTVMKAPRCLSLRIPLASKISLLSCFRQTGGSLRQTMFSLFPCSAHISCVIKAVCISDVCLSVFGLEMIPPIFLRHNHGFVWEDTPYWELRCQMRACIELLQHSLSEVCLKVDLRPCQNLFSRARS